MHKSLYYILLISLTAICFSACSPKNTIDTVTTQDQTESNPEPASSTETSTVEISTDTDNLSGSETALTLESYPAKETDREEESLISDNEEVTTESTSETPDPVTVETEFQLSQDLPEENEENPEHEFTEAPEDLTPEEDVLPEPADPQSLTDSETPISLTSDELEVIIPGVTGEYRLLFVSDLHIVLENEEIVETQLADMYHRLELFKTKSGIYAADLWPRMSQTIEDYHADAVLLGGDMVDFASSANIGILSAGLQNITAPIMYVRADHDISTWYTNLPDESGIELQNQMLEYREVYGMDFGEFLIVGVNNNTSQISPSALAEIAYLFQLGKPVILVTHVPLDSLISNDLFNLSMQYWNNNALIWGANSYYVPDDVTNEFMQLVYAEDSPVVQVLSGHLHFRNSTNLTETLNQHVFAPAFQGEIGVITVRGE